MADLMMPSIGGLDLFREVRRRGAAPATMVMTGFSTEATATEDLGAGFVGNPTTPYRVPQILAAAAEALGEA